MIKKRTIIAIIITTVTIIATNKQWLIFKPMPVDFDIKGKGQCNIEVQLNKKDNDKFNKIKSQNILLDLNKNTHANFNVKRSRFPKRIKFVITDLEDNSPVEMSNITLRNGKYKLDDLKQFSNSTGKLGIKNNSLIIYPDNNVINLEYKKTLQVRTAIKFDFKLFAIILILTYLLAYKLSNYVADFKTVKNKSRIEIIFLTIFFVFLFIPMSNISQENISKQENRTLAQYKPFINQDGEINYDYGKNFNEWFNDRFYLRQKFLDIQDLKLILSTNWITKDVMKGSNDWLFLAWKESTDSYSNSVMFTDEELNSIDSYLDNINKYCNTHNKKFYFIIAPDKSKIYPEYYPQRIMKVSDNSRSEQLIDYIKKHSNVNVIYPKEKLISLKGNKLLYWKNDTHWNLLGAYYGYSELMNVIKKDYATLAVYKVKDYTTEQHTGDLYNMAPAVLRKVDNTIYEIPKVDDSQLCKHPKEIRGNVICSNKSSNVNLLMYRDSFSKSLIPYLAHSFGDSKYIWKYDVNFNAMKNADVIILEIVERQLPTLVNKQLEVK